jgi:hypothetical protein
MPLPIGVSVSTLFPSRQRSNLLDAVFGNRNGQAQTSPAQAVAALRLADTNEARELTAKAREPGVARDLAAFERAVREARSVPDLLRNPAARRVLLTASGLGDQINNTALVDRALQSNPADANSLARRLSSTNAAFLTATQTFQFATRGLGIIQQDDVLQSVRDSYISTLRRQDLDSVTPGLSNALAFRETAASLTSEFAILGNPVARDVVTTAFGLPQQIAVQPLITQQQAIRSVIDVERLQDPAYVDNIARRYLIARNSTGVSLTA